MRTCGLIRQKKVNGKTSISVEKDKWIIFFSQYELSNVEIIMSKTSIVIDDKAIRKNMTFIRIGAKLLSSYLKATTQHNHHVLPPLIKMCPLRHYFLNSMSTDILEMMYWSDDECVSIPVICKNHHRTVRNLHLHHMTIHLFFNIYIPF